MWPNQACSGSNSMAAQVFNFQIKKSCKLGHWPLGKRNSRCKAFDPNVCVAHSHFKIMIKTLLRVF